jgi:hypothetical protein
MFCKVFILVVIFMLSCKAEKEVHSREDMALSEDLDMSALDMSALDMSALDMSAEIFCANELLELEDAHRLEITKICLEGGARPLWVKKSAPLSAGHKTWVKIPCDDTLLVRMGNIDTRRSITSVQVMLGDKSLLAGRPFGWASQVDRWLRVRDDLWLEVTGCEGSQCHLECHSHTPVIKQLDACPKTTESHIEVMK